VGERWWTTCRAGCLLARLRMSITLGDAPADLPPFVPPEE
jgi:hypothetical protein